MGCEEIMSKVNRLDSEGSKVLKYFIRYRSVGELLALRELKGLYGIKDPAKVIGHLLDLGLLERGLGCYNISRDVIKCLESDGKS
ncbi:MAG: hypothetical protein J7L12_02775 [Desulfurococcales archaeon]|nr:hypothetical protein [Desulfurococcales archaeon]